MSGAVVAATALSIVASVVPAVVVIAGAVIAVVAAVVAADLDGDGDKLTTNTEMSEPVVVLAADIDVDGNPGLVSTNYLTNDLTIFYRGTSAISCVLADVHLEPDCKDSLPSPS